MKTYIFLTFLVTMLVFPSLGQDTTPTVDEFSKALYSVLHPEKEVPSYNNRVNSFPSKVEAFFSNKEMAQLLEIGFLLDSLSSLLTAEDLARLKLSLGERSEKANKTKMDQVLALINKDSGEADSVLTFIPKNKHQFSNRLKDPKNQSYKKAASGE